MARWFVYVLRCRDGSLYTGVSTDVARRVAEHEAGRGARYTRGRGPFEIVLVERKRTRATAQKREAALKALPREEKLRLLPMRAAVAGLAALLCAGWLAAGAVLAAPPNGARAADRVKVPAGPFVRGSNRGEDDERPERKVTLPAFAIARTETTRAAYAVCVKAKKCSEHPAMGLAEPGSGDLPVTQVTWRDAKSYCAFAGGRLPKEDEWEKAARGADGRTFPWGEEADCARANWGNFDGEGPCAGQNPGKPVKVGSFPAGASPGGALDMAGNVWEWTASVHEDDKARRVVRGGSCCSYFVAPRASNRNAWHPEYRDADLGFRCLFAN